MWGAGTIFHHGAAQPWDLFPCDRVKTVEVSSTLSFALGTFYRSPHLVVEDSRQLVWHLLTPQTLLKKHLGAWMPTHVTDIWSCGLRVMAVQVGKDDLWVFFSPTIYSETWQILGLFQNFSFKSLHVADVAVCSPDTKHGLCLQSKIRDLSVFCVGTRVLDLLLIRWVRTKVSPIPGYSTGSQSTPEGDKRLNLSKKDFQKVPAVWYTSVSRQDPRGSGWTYPSHCFPLELKEMLRDFLLLSL